MRQPLLAKKQTRGCEVTARTWPARGATGCATCRIGSGHTVPDASPRDILLPSQCVTQGIVKRRSRPAKGGRARTAAKTARASAREARPAHGGEGAPARRRPEGPPRHRGRDLRTPQGARRSDALEGPRPGGRRPRRSGRSPRPRPRCWRSSAPASGAWSTAAPAIECIDLYEQSQQRHSAGIRIRAADVPRYFQALQTERAIRAHDARTDKRTSEFRKSYLEPLGITSMLDAPVFLRGKMAGSSVTSTPAGPGAGSCTRSCSPARSRTSSRWCWRPPPGTRPRTPCASSATRWRRRSPSARATCRRARPTCARWSTSRRWRWC